MLFARPGIAGPAKSVRLGESAFYGRGLADPDAIARGRTLGLRIGSGPPEQLWQIMDKATEICAKVVVSPNIKPE